MIHRMSLRISHLTAAAGILLLLGLAGCGAVDNDTAAEVRDVVREQIEQQADRISFVDPVRGETVIPVFDRVHEHVSETPGGRHVVCVDYRTAGGEVYDVDYYVNRADGRMLVQDWVLHKVGDQSVIAEEERKRLENESG